MAAASTNEERFVISCESVGESDVRNKLSAGRYSGRRSEWAANWLERVESGKSDATRAEENRSRLLKPTDRPRYLRPAYVGILLLGAALFGTFTFI
jgi:hypothetical protein